MPGIVGLVTQMPAARAQLELARMVEAIDHEPLYDTGAWCDERAGVYVGWRARKRPFSGALPLVHERGGGARGIPRLWLGSGESLAVRERRRSAGRRGVGRQERFAGTEGELLHTPGVGAGDHPRAGGVLPRGAAGFLDQPASILR